MICEVITIKLFIIGNGFDRAHGLPTSYWDFRTYLDNRRPEFLCDFEAHYDIYPASNEDAMKQMLWNELETNLANIDEETIIDQAVGIDMGLESGDVGIEDTLYRYFSDEYGYINQLANHLKQWVRTIRIQGATPKSTHIDIRNADYYVSFNYTAVLETVYKINSSSVLHIHGSLRQHDDNPVLGHGNMGRINNVKKNREEAERLFDEKWSSICKAVEDYYKRTYKNINRYMPLLHRLSQMPIIEIIIVGHSLAGVDLPYFEAINRIVGNHVCWKVYYYSEDEKQRMKDSLIRCSIDKLRIELIHSSQFYNL